MPPHLGNIEMGNNTIIIFLRKKFYMEVLVKSTVLIRCIKTEIIPSKRKGSVIMPHIANIQNNFSAFSNISLAKLSFRNVEDISRKMKSLYSGRKWKFNLRVYWRVT